MQALSPTSTSPSFHLSIHGRRSRLAIIRHSSAASCGDGGPLSGVTFLWPSQLAPVGSGLVAVDRGSSQRYSGVNNSAMIAPHKTLP